MKKFWIGFALIIGGGAAAFWLRSIGMDPESAVGVGTAFSCAGFFVQLLAFRGRCIETIAALRARKDEHDRWLAEALKFPPKEAARIILGNKHDTPK